jgi:hypothetical protein
MPKRKGDPPNLVSIRVRIPQELQTECREIQQQTSYKYEAESTFIRHLIHLGLEKYKRMLEFGKNFDKLPINIGESLNVKPFTVIPPDLKEKAKSKEKGVNPIHNKNRG